METIKAHPFISVGVLLAGVAIIALMRGGGGAGAPTTGVDASSVAAATALQQTQMQVQGAISAQQLNAQQAASHDAAAIQLADIQAKYGFDVATLHNTETLASIAANKDVVSLQSTLSAGVQQANIDAGKTIQLTNAAASVQSMAYLANALTTNSANNMNLALHQSDNTTAVNMALIAGQSGVAMAQINKPTCGFFSSLIGGC